VKKITGLIIIGSVAIWGGGNLTPAIPEVKKIANPCSIERVYVDHAKNLMWQDAPYTNAEDAAYAQEHRAGKVGSAGYAVNYCRRLSYAGHTDWRLPTADELMAIHHEEGERFNNVRDKDFWSSTPTTEGRYYVVYPADAYQYKRMPKQSNYIRCVRCIVKEK